MRWFGRLKTALTSVVGFLVANCHITKGLAQAPPPPPADPAADPYGTPDLGQMFAHMFYFVTNIRGLLRVIMFVTSAGLFMGAIIRFQKYRQNPVETPLSSVLLLLLVAILLLALAFVPIQADDTQ